MAKYDPKRPRPTVGDDQAAPVEALIEAVSAGPDPVVDRTEAAAVVTAAPAPSAVASPAPEAAPAPAPQAAPASAASPTQPAPDEAPIDDSPKPSAPKSEDSSGKSPEAPGEFQDPLRLSDVAVIPPPGEGTANRAVLAAVATGLVIALVLAIAMKLRRNRG